MVHDAEDPGADHRVPPGHQAVETARQGVTSLRRDFLAARRKCIEEAQKRWLLQAYPDLAQAIREAEALRDQIGDSRQVHQLCVDRWGFLFAHQAEAPTWATMDPKNLKHRSDSHGKKLIATHRRPDYVGGKLVGYWKTASMWTCLTRTPAQTRPAKAAPPRPLTTRQAAAHDQAPPAVPPALRPVSPPAPARQKFQMEFAAALQLF